MYASFCSRVTLSAVRALRSMSASTFALRDVTALPHQNGSVGCSRSSFPLRGLFLPQLAQPRLATCFCMGSITVPLILVQGWIYG